MARETYNKMLLKAIVHGKDKTSVSAKQYREVVSKSKNEDDIQKECIDWFKRSFPKEWEHGALYHIPNEGKRSYIVGARFRRVGLVKGVADLCLRIPRGGYGALYIEMKKKGNYQTPEQKEWGKNCEADGNKYVVCKSLDEFSKVVLEYVALPKPQTNG